MCGCVDMKPPALSPILMIEREYDEKLKERRIGDPWALHLTESSCYGVVLQGGGWEVPLHGSS